MDNISPDTIDPETIAQMKQLLQDPDNLAEIKKMLHQNPDTLKQARKMLAEQKPKIKKIKPNSPCSCDSGLKYKKCCYGKE